MAKAKQEEMDGAQALIKTLNELGVEYIFGYSGGAALPMFDALETVESNIKFLPYLYKLWSFICFVVSSLNIKKTLH